jgi:NADH:ubiquinone oxidoreductase subunit E
MKIDICPGSSCHLKGAYEVFRIFQGMAAEISVEDKIEMRGSFCMKRCQEGVSVSIGDECYSVSPESARDFFRETVARRV